MKHWRTEGIGQFKVGLEEEEAKDLWSIPSNQKQQTLVQNTGKKGWGDKEGWDSCNFELKDRQCDVTVIKWREALLIELIRMVLLDEVKKDISDLLVKPQIFIEWQLFCPELCPGHMRKYSLLGRVNKYIWTDS